MPRTAKSKSKNESKKGTGASRQDTKLEERVVVHHFFITRLREVMDANGIPVVGRSVLLARLTGRTKQATSHWLRRDSLALPDVIALRRISIAFNLDPAYLLGLRSTTSTNVTATKKATQLSKPKAPSRSHRPAKKV